MSLESTPTEYDDRPDAFVWGHDLSPVARQALYSPDAYALYEDTEPGLRVKHVVFLAQLLELRHAVLEEGGCDSPPRSDNFHLPETVADQLADINSYLNKKLGGGTLAELANVPSNPGIEQHQPPLKLVA